MPRNVTGLKKVDQLYFHPDTENNIVGIVLCKTGGGNYTAFIGTAHITKTRGQANSHIMREGQEIPAIIWKSFFPNFVTGKRVVPPSHFVKVVAANIENGKISDGEFREFVRSALSVTDGGYLGT